LQLGVRRPTAVLDEVLEALSTSTNQGAVVFGLNSDSGRGFLRDLVSNDHDRSLGGGHSLLRSANGDVGQIPVIRSLVYVDLRVGRVLDFVDGGSAPAKDACNRPVGDSEFENVVGFFLKLDSLWRCQGKKI
jgi:hypothetical protein